MENQETSVSRIQIIEKLIFVLFMIVVAAGVCFVMLFKYQPNQNALGALASVCMDIVCIIMLTILSTGLIFRRDRMTKTTRIYVALLVGTVWGLFMDFLVWSADGSLTFSNWTYAFTMLSMCTGSILAGIFSLYLGYYMDDMYGLKKVHISARICAGVNVLAFVITLTLALTKQAFSFVDGHYRVGELYDYVTALPVLTLIYMTIYAFAHIKKIGVHDAIAVAGYILIMIVGALIESEYSVGTSFVGITVANVYIYMMLQSKSLESVKKQIVEEKKNAEKWMLKSNIDDMTGFFNRHAYEEEIVALEQEPLKENFAYVSIDVNGLKVVNDTLGHGAGDELIVGASECMKQCFGAYGNLYRTGGDEFVALIYVDEEKLEGIKEDLKDATSKWMGAYNKRINLSCGYVTGKEAEDMTLHQVAVMADKRMYADKTRYYQRKGVDRRGQRDAHVALCALYTKILKINVTDDTYQIVNMFDDEKTKDKGFTDKISTWLSEFGTSGQVHPDDLEDYLAKTSIEYISSYFKRNQKSLCIFYRRKYDNDYKKVMMEIIPANDYSDKSQNLFLYVKNIEQ